MHSTGMRSQSKHLTACHQIPESRQSILAPRCNDATIGRERDRGNLLAKPRTIGAKTVSSTRRQFSTGSISCCFSTFKPGNFLFGFFATRRPKAQHCNQSKEKNMAKFTHPIIVIDAGVLGQLSNEWSPGVAHQ